KPDLPEANGLGGTTMKRIMITVSIAIGLLMSVARAGTPRSIRAEEDSARARGGVHGGGSSRTSVKRCQADAVPVGSVCLDIYEASVWRGAHADPTEAR